MDVQRVYFGIGLGNFYLNLFFLSFLLNDFDKRLDYCFCLGYLGVKVYFVIFDDIGDLYVFLIQVGFIY